MILHFDTLFLFPATQQGTGTGSPQLGLRGNRRESAQRTVWGYSQGRHLAVQVGQQAGSRLREEDPRAWHQFPADGEHSALPGGGQEIRRARGGNIPNCRFVRASQYSTSHPIALCPGSHCKLDILSFQLSIFFMLYVLNRRKSIPSTLALLWAPRCLRRTNASSPKNSSALMRVNLTCRWASTRAPPNRAMVASATRATCNLAINTLQRTHTQTHTHKRTHTQPSTPKNN